MAKKYRINHNCMSCGACVGDCPVGAMKVTPKTTVIDPAKCTGCGRCVDNCSPRAIEAYEAE